MLPISVIVGPLGGRLADQFGRAGYIAVFAAGTVMAAVAMLGFLLLVREPRSDKEMYFRIRKI
jgi:nitrate/nitrite transporter NarK